MFLKNAPANLVYNDFGLACLISLNDDERWISFPEARMPWLNLVDIPTLFRGPQSSNHFIKFVKFFCNIYLLNHDIAWLSTTWIVSILHFKPLSNFGFRGQKPLWLILLRRGIEEEAMLWAIVKYLSQRESPPHAKNQEDPGHQHDNALHYSISKENSNVSKQFVQEWTSAEFKGFKILVSVAADTAISLRILSPLVWNIYSILRTNLLALPKLNQATKWVTWRA